MIDGQLLMALLGLGCALWCAALSVALVHSDAKALRLSLLSALNGLAVVLVLVGTRQRKLDRSNP